ncbi:hypothetical protein [Delftia sp. PS-11]|uniref:hypothetical protein n=1 Tax=Delftia sp. PS-11 TaxID=2767222 RepID=UPI00245822EB|nr:hypothetical protein [Delftia sp. PS-11]KAJ8740797.1 hypothetical protein H9T68_22890 [Delftia sp. PS-11]
MSPPKVPPRFVPTLTDVVPGHAGTAPDLRPDPAVTDSMASPQEPSSWGSENMPPEPPRRGVVSLPASLPPLPPGLAPQFPLADGPLPEPPAMEPVLSPAAPVAPPPLPLYEHDLLGEAPQPRQAEAAVPASMDDAMDGLWEVHAQKVTEEYLVHRLMQRVDLVLDQRLRDAIATVVQEQTRSIVVRLREEVESVVRQAVYEAVADELAQQARTARDG